MTFRAVDRRRLAAAALALGLASSSAGRIDGDEPALDLDAITESAIRAHIGFLASDALEGREVGTRGAALTRLYLQSCLERSGLEPPPSPAVAGASPAWTQAFELDAASYADVALEVGERSFRIGADLRVIGGAAAVEGEIVFCGYGITAPEFEYDDYDGLDVRGKIVLLLRHEPLERGDDGADGVAWFQGASHTGHATFDAKARNAAERGAAAVIIVNDPVHCSEQAPVGAGAERAILGLRRRSEGDGDGNGDGDGDGAPAAPRRGRGRAARVPVVFGSSAVLDHLEGALGLREIQTRIDAERRPQSRATGLRARLRVEPTMEVVAGHNVAAALAGSDPVLRDEWVVVGAHIDHEGVRDGEVFNGANDNASGTTALVLVAEALARQTRRPRRSILFVGFDAEEKGLLGSRHYVLEPIVPLEKTVAMINMDMVGRSKGNSVQVHGAFHAPALGELSRRALARAGITEPDFSERRINARSDHWPFFERGIPVLVFHSDDEEDYHQPTDDAPKITVEVMARIVRAVAMSVWETADAPERPKLRQLRRF